MCNLHTFTVLLFPFLKCLGFEQQAPPFPWVSFIRVGLGTKADREQGACLPSGCSLTCRGLSEGTGQMGTPLPENVWALTAHRPSRLVALGLHP